MITETMVKPSYWIEKGIQIESIQELYLFKFGQDLQERLDNLNQKKKSESLNTEETAELAGILELDRIFTLINAKIIAQISAR
ncbi:hypothetical protein [Gloeocapsa sp. PCC 73106]|uniref:hypothetical protein n=1 Tax=Gloeocapsa sp. PCC 73106 TaxID=102232 RepID=UPI0002ACDC1B|nr:hypothetical protein [Gloeocapsa sp. PCC 73106]ELR96480.1 hypothetical protein GLO73106DRAFT_00002740 [Gloeocapsa sp. PCC 73106]